MELRGFVAPAGNATWGLGASAFEVGSAYLRHEPLERRARPLLVKSVHTLKKIGPVVGHVGILRGNDTLYLLKESSSSSITLVTDVGVRLPAGLTASGRAMLAHLPDAQVRALFPRSTSFVDRTGRGPQSLSALRRLLRSERRIGFSLEEGFITPGYSSVASAVLDHLGQPIAAVGITFREESMEARYRAKLTEIVSEVVKDSANMLTQGIGGRQL